MGLTATVLECVPVRLALSRRRACASDEQSATELTPAPASDPGPPRAARPLLPRRRQAERSGGDH